jgi:hypothetical protein
MMLIINDTASVPDRPGLPPRESTPHLSEGEWRWQKRIRPPIRQRRLGAGSKRSLETDDDLKAEGLAD